MFRKFIAAFAVAVVLPFTFAGTAEATRPGPPGFPDQCNNIAGNQQPYQLVGTGPYRFNTATADPNDCIVVQNPKGKRLKFK